MALCKSATEPVPVVERFEKIQGKDEVRQGQGLYGCYGMYTKPNKGI